MWAWSWQPWKLYSEDSYFLRKTGRMRTGEATDTDRLRSMKARHLRNWPRPRRYILGGTWHMCLEGVECRMGVPETCVARYLRIQQLLRRYTICVCLEGRGVGWQKNVWLKNWGPIEVGILQCESSQTRILSAVTGYWVGSFKLGTELCKGVIIMTDILIQTSWREE